MEGFLNALKQRFAQVTGHGSSQGNGILNVMAKRANPVNKTGPGYDQPMGQPKGSPQISAPTPPLSSTPVQGTTSVPGYGRNPSFSKFQIAPEVHQAITKASKAYGVPPELLYDIAAQESSLNPKLVNTTPAGVQAGNPTGLYQFTDETWKQILSSYNNKPGMSLKLPNTDRNDPNTNAAAAAYLIKNGQLGKWDASEDVWGNYWTPQELEKLGFYNQTKYHQPGVRPSVRLRAGK